eukprot:6210071-Pleurochrysis_carterae.AAC.1
MMIKSTWPTRVRADDIAIHMLEDGGATMHAGIDPRLGLILIQLNRQPHTCPCMSPCCQFAVSSSFGLVFTQQNVTCNSSAKRAVPPARGSAEPVVLRSTGSAIRSSSRWASRRWRRTRTRTPCWRRRAATSSAQKTKLLSASQS